MDRNRTALDRAMLGWKHCDAWDRDMLRKEPLRRCRPSSVFVPAARCPRLQCERPAFFNEAGMRPRGERTGRTTAHASVW